MLYKIKYGLVGEEYNAEIEEVDDFAAYYHAIRILDNMVEERKLAKGIFLEVQRDASV